MPWNILYSDAMEQVLDQEKHQVMRRGSHPATQLPLLGQEWSVGLEVHSADYSYSGWTNILHITTGYIIHFTKGDWKFLNPQNKPIVTINPRR